MFLQFFGLKEQPFGVTPDPRFLYLGAEQQEAFASLLYGIETGRGFMALIARPGLGKTTVLLRLMDRLRDSARTAFLFHSHSDSVDFLRSLLTDLGVEPTSQNLGDLQRQLADFLIQENRAGKRIVVVIDEAQNLEPGMLETIRMLSNFESVKAKLLQIVLAGQPQLANLLVAPHMEQLRQRVSVIARLTPLDRNEVQKYIDHRLGVAGYEGGSLFTSAALHLIVAHSLGVPRNINNLCFQAMSLAYAKNLKTIDEAVLREVIADLDLRAIGTAPSNPVKRRENASVPVGAQDVVAAGGSAPTKVTVGSGNKALLDTVDLTSRAAPHGDHARRGVRRPPAPPVPTHGKRMGQTVVLVGLVALLVWLCSGVRFQSTVLYLEQLARVLPVGTADHVGTTTTVVPSVNTPPPTPQVPAQKAPDSATESQPEGTNILSAEPAAPEIPSSTPKTTTGDNGVASRLAHPSFLSHRETPEQSHGTPAVRDDGYTPGAGKLVVESSAGAARITINGRSMPLWVTPRAFYLPAGTYVVSVYRGGFLPWQDRVYVTAGREQWVNADLRGQDDGAVFTVDTEPAGMQVFIDGKAYGPSRVETVLRPGWHICEVIPAPGYKALIKRFHLNPGEAVTRRIRMNVPSAPAPNSGQVTGPITGPTRAAIMERPQGVNLE